MKTISNKFIATIAISSSLLLLSVSPVMALTGTSEIKRAQSAACTRITTLKDANEATVATHITALRTNFAARLSKITSDESAADQKIATARANADNKFTEKVQTLLTQANLSDSQIQAINTYKTNMEQSNTVRIIAVDAARNQYRAALLNMVTAHQQTLTDAANSYKAAVTEAFNTAVTNCSNGNVTTSSLRISIKSARQSLTTARETTKITASIKQLETTRNEAVKAANKTFSELAAVYAKTLTSALKTTN